MISYLDNFCLQLDLAFIYGYNCLSHIDNEFDDYEAFAAYLMGGEL